MRSIAVLVASALSGCTVNDRVTGGIDNGAGEGQLAADGVRFGGSRA